MQPEQQPHSPTLSEASTVHCKVSSAVLDILDPPRLAKFNFGEPNTAENIDARSKCCTPTSSPSAAVAKIVRRCHQLGEADPGATVIAVTGPTNDCVIVQRLFQQVHPFLATPGALEEFHDHIHCIKIREIIYTLRKSLFRSYITTCHIVGNISYQDFVQWPNQEPQHTTALSYTSLSDVDFNILIAAMNSSLMDDLNGKVHDLTVGQAIVAVEYWTLHARTDHEAIQFTLLWLLNVDRFDQVTQQDRMQSLKKHSVKVNRARTDYRRLEKMVQKWNESAGAALVKKSKHVCAQDDFNQLQRAFKQHKESANQRIQTLQRNLTSVNGELVSVKGKLASANQRIKTLEGELVSQKESANDRIKALQGELASVNGELVSHKRTANERIKTLEGELVSQKESANDRIQALQGELASANERIETLEGELVSQKQSANDRIKALQGELDSVNVELASVKEEARKRDEAASAFQEETRKQFDAMNKRLLAALGTPVAVTAAE
ncbi:hypothetical protein FN846DRAFT_889754 [Sphaerosporella brunnea]|uniref:Uncharacterized protein n=1 Tax=Sphaerosporella brunnea TaxID=1250544 RepID=A0A5J5EYJ9_9PEZI|nr:hypothetical protein FN846DRAFT_889754 [Sphaerosporella brunnea]